MTETNKTSEKKDDDWGEELRLAEEKIADATSFTHLFEILKSGAGGNDEDVIELIEDIRDKAQGIRATNNEEFREVIIGEKGNKEVAEMLRKVPHGNDLRKVVLKLLRNEVFERSQINQTT